MIYCTKCGTSNPEGTLVCTQCNARLPVLDAAPAASIGSSPTASNATASANPSATPSTHLPVPTPVPAPIQTAAPVAASFGSISPSWWQRLGPDWKAALIFWFGRLILLGIDTVTGGLGFFFTVPFYIAFALGQGVLVARLASQDSRYTKADFLRLGLLSGLWALMLDLMNFIVVFTAVAGVTLGAMFAALPGIIVLSAGRCAFMIALTSLGAWLYGRYGGKKLVGALVGSGCGCLIIVGVLLAIAITALASYGIQLWGS